MYLLAINLVSNSPTQMLKIKAAKVWLHHQDMQSAQEKELKFVLVIVS